MKSVRYRKGPVVVEAMQYLREENISSVQDWFYENNRDRNFIYNPEDNEYYIQTPEGRYIVNKGDYIIKGAAGEFYPCTPDIFYKTYEKVEED